MKAKNNKFGLFKKFSERETIEMGIIAKKSFVVTIINIIGIGIGALGILFFQTKYLSQEEIGSLKTLNALALLIFPFISLGFGSAVYRFYNYFENQKKELNQFLSLVIFLPLLLLLFYTLVSFLFRDFINEHFFKNSPYLLDIVYLLPGMIFHNIYIALFDSLLTVKNKIFLSNFLRSIASRIYLIVLIVLYASKTITFNQLLFLYIILHLVNIAVIGYSFFKTSEFTVKPGFKNNTKFKEFSTYSMYVIFGSLSGVIVSQIDTLMTGSLTQSLGKVGVYTVAFFMGVVIETPKKPIIQMATPLISRHLANNETEVVLDLFKKSAINLFILGGLIFVIIWGNIDSIFQIIPNGINYTEGKYVVFYIGLSKLFDLAVGINFEIIQYSKHYRWNIFLTPLLAILAIVSNFYFITNYGIVGTAIATAISILLYNTISSFVVYKKLGMNAITYRHVLVAGLMVLVLFITNYVVIENLYLSIVLKSGILTVLFLVPIYLMKVSQELNRFIHSAINRIKK